MTSLTFFTLTLAQIKRPYHSLLSIMFIFTCFLFGNLICFRSDAAVCYTPNSRKKQVKIQKQVKKHAQSF
jgi:hypothetical protein